METTSPPPAFEQQLQRLNLHLSAGMVDQLRLYLERLLATNRRMNLTAVVDTDEAWMRLIADSLSLLPYLGQPDMVADIGSGGGLPGIPLAVARPGVAFTLMEATGKKARFLDEVKRELRLSNVQVRAERAETLGRQPEHRGRYDVVTGRAVGPLRIFLELAVPLLRLGGTLLTPKGKHVDEEIAGAHNALAALGARLVAVHHPLPEQENPSVVVEVRQEEPTADKYPRRPGMPKKRPL